MDGAFLDEVKRYVGFSDDDAAALERLRPLLESNARRVIDLFYDVILEHPRAGKAITGGQAQVERLKETLRRWLVELADGRYGADYLARRAAIGRRHVLIELPQVFMVTAMDVVRRELSATIRASYQQDVPHRERILDALHKILDIDLAIMLETYQEDSLEKVRRSERRAMVGDLAAKVNHELRSRLGTIRSSAFLLEKQLEATSEPVAKHLRKIQWGAERAGATVAALLNLARELKPQLVSTDVHHVIREAAAVVHRAPDVAIELELGRGTPRVHGDPELLVAVIANLLQNAVDAHEGHGGRVVVRTALEGSSVVIRILDEGTGLSTEVTEHMFEPFFTTKREGTGLGLTIADQIVRAHGGKIEARSRSDRNGAEFVVELKLDEERVGR